MRRRSDPATHEARRGQHAARLRHGVLHSVWKRVDRCSPNRNRRSECPNCHTQKGKWKFEFAPAEGTLVRECNCGNQLFYLTTEGHMCANCGTYQKLLTLVKA